MMPELETERAAEAAEGGDQGSAGYVVAPRPASQHGRVLWSSGPVVSVGERSTSRCTAEVWGVEA